MTKKKGIIVSVVILILLVLGIVFSVVSLDKGQLGNVDYIAYPKVIKLGLDLKGGVYAVYLAERPETMTEEEFKRRIDGTVQNFEDLLLGKGYTEAKVNKNAVTGQTGEIRVEVPNVDNPKKIFDLIGKPATILFKKTENNDFDVNSSDVVLSGEDIKSTGVGLDENMNYDITLNLTAEGAKKFDEATAQLVSSQAPIHIYIDGKLLISPRVQARISNGSARITGNYTYEEANNLAIRIQSGALPLKLNLVESDTISPTLGSGALRNGLISGGIGLLLIFVLLIALYGISGLAASLALIYYTITYLFFLAIFPWSQLTLPGIAGILLSIGMAVDANIIIFERIKEEYRMSEGLKSISTCVRNGFRRSASAIIDGNVTTIIGAIVLAIFGVASIKGFAVTLLIGIVISLFSSLVVTRLLLSAFISFKSPNPKFYGLTIKSHKFLVASHNGATLEKEDKVLSSNIQNDNEKNDSQETMLENDNVVTIESQQKMSVANNENKKFASNKGKYKKMDRKNPPAEREFIGFSGKKTIINTQNTQDDEQSEEVSDNE